jgi:hypothetical protein
VLSAALTALPQPSPTAAAMSAQQTFMIPTVAPVAEAVAKADRVEPTPPTIHEELERCVSYSVVDDEVHRAVMLPDNAPLLVMAKNSCDMSFTPDDSWFEIRATDRARNVIARKTGRFITSIPAKGTAETAIVLYPVEDRLRLQVTYSVKPWWAAGGGRRMGE